VTFTYISLFAFNKCQSHLLGKVTFLKKIKDLLNLADVILNSQGEKDIFTRKKDYLSEVSDFNALN